MAIGFEQVSSSSEGTGNLSWTHAGTSPDCVLVMVAQVGSSDSVTAVTYGGLSLTEVALSPLLKSTGEAAGVHAYFRSGNLGTGNQTVAVTTTGTVTKIGVCLTMTSSTDAGAIQDTTSISNDSLQDPSGTLSLGGIDCFSVLIGVSGQQTAGGVAPLTGWTSSLENDFGAMIGVCYWKTVNQSTDVTFGWTATADDVTCLGIAIKQVSSGPKARITAADAEITYSTIKGRLTAADAEATYSTVLGKITAADAEVTYNVRSGKITAADLDVTYDPIKARIVAADSEITYTTVVGKITAADLDVTYMPVTGKMTAVDTEITYSITGVPTGRITAADAEITYSTIASKITAVDVEATYDTIKGKVTAADAEITYTLRGSKITAADIEITYTPVGGKITAADAEVTYAQVLAKIAATDAEITYDAVKGKIVAADAEITYTIAGQASRITAADLVITFSTTEYQQPWPKIRRRGSYLIPHREPRQLGSPRRREA